jgi:hypothetical protein
VTRLRALAPALVLALLPLVGGCGGDNSIDAYCAQVQADSKKLAEITSGEASGGALLDALPMLRALGDKAPDDLQDEWQTFLNALRNLDDALRNAGVEPDDFQDGKPPAGVTALQLKAIQDAASQIGESDVVASVKGIEQQARDVCKVNIGV